MGASVVISGTWSLLSVSLPQCVASRARMSETEFEGENAWCRSELAGHFSVSSPRNAHEHLPDCSLDSWTSCHGDVRRKDRHRYGASPGPDAFLRRAIPVHGLRPATYRESLAPSRPLQSTTSYRHGLPPAGPAFDARQRKARMRIHATVTPIGHPVTLYVTIFLGLDLDVYATWNNSTSNVPHRSFGRALPHHQ